MHSNTGQKLSDVEISMKRGGQWTMCIPLKEVVVIDGDGSPSTLGRSLDKGKRSAPVLRKKSNTLFRDEFLVVTGSFDSGGTFQYLHCEGAKFTWRKWNVSKARSHLERCGSTSPDTRAAVSSSSQPAKKQKSTLSSISTSETGCLYT
jgi:hypothetical protein